MALGLGFNKAKILQSAEKYVLQGKLPAAIAEYQKILKRDPKDLMTLNTVGDLYVRSGQVDEATKCFYDLAEKSIEAGFVPRAIAVYKRITKLEPEALPALTRLGELYSMQGLMRDARTHYLQAVEIYMRRRQPDHARQVFEKILMLDMENPRLQRRMAELYAETGKKTEAVATYLSAAERFLEIKEPAEASATLDSLGKLDSANLEAQTLRGRVLLEQGDAAKAIETLQTLAVQESGKGALESLFRAYINQGDLAQATATAQQLFERHEDFSCLAAATRELVAKGDVDAALRIYQGAAEKLQSQRSFQVLIEGLRGILKADSTNILALELLWGAYRASGDIAEGRETAEQLAHAYVAAEQLAQARDVYAELVALEPDVVEHQRMLKQIESRLGEGGTGLREETAGEPTPLMAMEAAAPPEEESSRVETLPPREQEIVKNCLTESELYVTYKQFSKAIETLEKGLEEIPRDASLHEHLIPLYEQSLQYGKAAKCAEALTEIYVTLGDGERAARYGELVSSYQQKAQEAGSEAVVETNFDMETLSAPEAETEEAVMEEPQVREIDLSMEWATLSDASTSTAAESTAESIVEEIEFYLQAGLAAEAAAALERLRQEAPEHASLVGFEERLAASQPAGVATQEPALGEMVADGQAPAPVETPSAEPEAALEALPTEPEPELAVPAPEEVSEPREEVVEPAAPPAPAVAEEAPVLAAQPEQELALEELIKAQPTSAAGFELSLDEPAPAAAVRAEASGPAPSPTPPPASSAPGAGFLDDVFAEFKEDVGEATATSGEEDMETHYNMGVAFKEMALYDEAIGEFQKVHQLAEKAKDYSHVVQCCSLLATCFLEKGMPQLAAQWYQTAINAPGVDSESSLALLYELASAQEAAGERQSALKSFMEVYARNIDYRNVAERIQELKQHS
jgi:tetratricopeptide (TPR) repeat protein